MGECRQIREDYGKVFQYHPEMVDFPLQASISWKVLPKQLLSVDFCKNMRICFPALLRQARRGVAKSWRGASWFPWNMWICFPKKRMIRWSACCHCPAFSQQLIRALQVITSGARSVSISSKISSACCQWLAFSQELMLALNEITCGFGFRCGNFSEETSSLQFTSHESTGKHFLVSEKH